MGHMGRDLFGNSTRINLRAICFLCELLTIIEEIHFTIPANDNPPLDSEEIPEKAEHTLEIFLRNYINGFLTIKFR